MFFSDVMSVENANTQDATDMRNCGLNAGEIFLEN